MRELKFGLSSTINSPLLEIIEITSSFSHIISGVLSLLRMSDIKGIFEKFPYTGKPSQITPLEL